jgi:homoserine dehydrogenase
VSVRDYTKLPARYYLRFTVEDRPTVLAQIAGELGKNNVSIASVIQHEPDPGGEADTVPLVIMTHTATEGDSQRAIEEIDQLPCVHGESVRMRVLEN